MPASRSPFPTGRLSQIWGYFVNALQSNVSLKRGVETWQTWTGSIEDVQAIPLDQFPVLMLSPGPGSLEWTDEARHGGTWQIKVDLAIPSTEAAYLLDFWEALYGAMPWPYLNQELVDLGCYQISVVGPAIELVELSNNEMGSKASGVIMLRLNVSDPE